MDCNHSGSQRDRRDRQNMECLKLVNEIPFDFGKLSQTRILKAAITYLKKEKHFSSLKARHGTLPRIDSMINYEELTRNEGLMGFLICFSAKGELIYLSETSNEFLGFKAIDVLLTYEYVHDMAHEQDRANFKYLEDNHTRYMNGEKFSFYSSWFISKIKRKSIPLSDYKLFKISGHFDPVTNLYVAICTPILSISNREALPASNSMCFASSHRLNLQFHELSLNGQNILGYDSKENISQRTLYELLSPESLTIIGDRHKQLLATKNTKGSIDTIRLLKQDGSYVDCLVNMYYENRGFIICKYQTMSHYEVSSLKEYLKQFQREKLDTEKINDDDLFYFDREGYDTSLSSPEFNLNEESEIVLNKKENSKSNGNKKRKSIFANNDEEDDVKKIIKIEKEQIEINHNNFYSDEPMIINNIKENLQKEVSTIPKDFYFNLQTTAPAAHHQFDHFDYFSQEINLDFSDFTHSSTFYDTHVNVNNFCFEQKTKDLNQIYNDNNFNDRYYINDQIYNDTNEPEPDQFNNFNFDDIHIDLSSFEFQSILA